MDVCISTIQVIRNRVLLLLLLLRVHPIVSDIATWQNVSQNYFSMFIVFTVTLLEGL